MPAFASPWNDRVGAEDPSGRLFDEVVTLAFQLASAAGSERDASLLLLRGGLLTCVATTARAGTDGDGPYRLSEHPELDQALTSGELVDGPSEVLIPVPAEGRVVGLLVIAGQGSLEQHERRTLVALAKIVGLGCSQAASIDELQEEAERSRSLDRLKSEFLNIAAHELRSPLGIIRGYSSMLSEGTLPAADRDVALTRIVAKAEEMAQLISEMLETARLETHGLELELEPVDLRQVIDDAVDAMRPLLGGAHEFVLAAPRDPIAVVADRPRITRMLTNLIDNAIKYSPEGGEIAIDCTCDDRAATIAVRDHGIGINAEQAHLLFTRFGRLVTPETSHIRGTGLGLYLARETARLHGGDIVVAPTVGGGSTFAVQLPLV